MSLTDKQRAYLHSRYEMSKALVLKPSITAETKMLAWVALKEARVGMVEGHLEVVLGQLEYK